MTPQSRTAATEPQVPGPGLPIPAPKNVATVQAQGVLRAVSGGGETVAGLFVILFPALATDLAKIFKDFGIQDGRADFVDAHGPLAKIDLAAAVAAEREVFVFGGDQHAAGGAMQELCGFFLLRHGYFAFSFLDIVTPRSDACAGARFSKGLAGL